MQSSPSSRKLKPKYFQATFEGIGTVWTIELWGVEAASAEAIMHKLRARVAAFEAVYSRFRSDSLVGQMAKKAGVYEITDDAKPMFDMYQKIYRITGGSVTPLIGQALSDAGYDHTYSLVPKRIKPVPEWEEVLEYAFPKLHVKKPVLLDFGGLGKGALIDITAGILEEAGVKEYVVNAGGDIFVSKNEAVEVALQHPGDDSLAVGLAKIKAGALCGSAGTYRRWAGYTHIINPHTKRSPVEFQAIWVHADTALLADALTSALYFMPATELHKHFDFEYAMIKADGSLDVSGGFPAVFFTKENL